MVKPSRQRWVFVLKSSSLRKDQTLRIFEDSTVTPLSAKRIEFNTALGGTAFTISIDAKGPDVTTGISAHDRAQTIWAVADANSRPEDFARPGHVFPLRARPGGVLERRGQTEAAVDLAGLAGLYPAGVICEIINDDGTMARLPDLTRFCRKHQLLMITVSELARYRMDLLDGDGVIEALEGLIPMSPRLSAQKVRRWEPGNLCLAG